MATQIRSDEMWEKDCQAYDEVRKTCDAFKQKNIDGQDKMVMSISSALFGILLAIFDKDLLIKSQISSCWFKILILSNALTLILVLVSFYMGNKSLDKIVENARVYLLKNKQRKMKNHYTCIANTLNKVYLSTTCVTVATLAIIMLQIF